MRRLLALLLLVNAVTAGAQERIVDFGADIAIGTDGTLTVTETIAVRSEGQSIKRGILRDFPTEYRDRAGNAVRVPFDVVGVRRDGAAEDYAIESLDNGVRVRIGHPDVLLPRGEHTYTITYRTARQLGFFAEHDELYWNVTGNGWTFAIDRATARLTLPRPVPAAQLTVEGYTGPQGARGTDYLARVVTHGVAWKPSLGTPSATSARRGSTVVHHPDVPNRPGCAAVCQLIRKILPVCVPTPGASTW